MAFLSRSRLIHLSLLILLSSSCAWANDGARHEAPREARRRGLGDPEGGLDVRKVMAAAAAAHGAEDAMPLWRRVGVEIREVVDHVEKLVERRQHPARSPLPTRAAEHADKLVRDACLALITPAPALKARQDNGQIQALSNQLQQLSAQSRQVSQASQQVSQQSQQLSQSLQQANQQLSQTRDQLATARAQSSAASQAAQQASDAARQASDAARQASSSADSAISAAFSSASSSASANAASVLAAASVSASSIMNNAASMVRQAQADATAVRNEATNQVQQAQGAAVSVTQAALAIVGAIIGSSLVTILTFMLILRYRRIKRRQSRLAASSRNNISYPALSKTSNPGYGPSVYESNFGAGPRDVDNNGFPVDVKEPPRAAGVGGPMGLQRSNTSSSDGRGAAGPGFGYATSDYGPAPEANSEQDREFKLNEAPKGKFSLFPRPRDDPQPTASTLNSTMNSTSPKPRGSKIFPPSLDTWLRAGTVSPFGTLQKPQDNANKSDWPMKKGA